MIHFLTAGFIDAAAVKRCQVHVIAPLDKKLVAVLVEQYRDKTGFSEITFEGERVLINQGYVRCPWYTPRMNLTSIKFILDLQAATDCIVADIEHGRIITPVELTELLPINSPRRNNGGSIGSSPDLLTQKAEARDDEPKPSDRGKKRYPEP